MAQAYHLYVSLLEGPRSSVPRDLPPGPCGGGTGRGLTLAYPPRHCTRTDSGLTLTVLPSVSSPSIHQRPARAVILDGKCLSPHLCILIIFMEIYDYIFIRLFRSFLKVTFDSFSSSAPSI